MAIGGQRLGRALIRLNDENVRLLGCHAVLSFTRVGYEVLLVSWAAMRADYTTTSRVRPIFGGLVEHEKPICLRTPENVVRTPNTPDD